MQRAGSLLLLVCLSLPACVSRWHHDATVYDLVEAEAEAEQARRHLVGMQQQIDRQQTQIAALESGARAEMTPNRELAAIERIISDAFGRALSGPRGMLVAAGSDRIDRREEPAR